MNMRDNLRVQSAGIYGWDDQCGDGECDDTEWSCECGAVAGVWDSGSGHSQGAVPDPGALPGASRYLREDGTWAVPAGRVVGRKSVGSGCPERGSDCGATADYNFLQGTGTVLTDNSGNRNNGTLGTGALAPTWTPTGLDFHGPEAGWFAGCVEWTKTFFFGFICSRYHSFRRTAFRCCWRRGFGKRVEPALRPCGTAAPGVA